MISRTYTEKIAAAHGCIADGPYGHSALGWRFATGPSPGDTAEDSEQDGDSEKRDVGGLSLASGRSAAITNSTASEKESQRRDLRSHGFIVCSLALLLTLRVSPNTRISGGAQRRPLHAVVGLAP